MPAIEDTDLLTVFVLGFFGIFTAIFATEEDDYRSMVISGILFFLLAFQLWTILASIPVTIAVVVIGILMLALPVEKLFNR